MLTFFCTQAVAWLRSLPPQCQLMFLSKPSKAGAGAVKCGFTQSLSGPPFCAPRLPELPEYLQRRSNGDRRQLCSFAKEGRTNRTVLIDHTCGTH